jgi:hypothetical protein
MHDKAPLQRALAELHNCSTFQDVCRHVEGLALDGERVAFSKEAVQKAHFHDGSGIHSLLPKQPGPLSHYFAAQGLKCPSAAAHHEVSSDLQAAAEAVAGAFKAGDNIGRWRMERLLLPLQEQLDRLRPWDEKLRALKPPSVEAVSGEVPIATIACLVKALKWPHTELPLCLLAGFDIVGEIPATGVYPRAVGVQDAVPIGSLDHAADNAAMVTRLRAKWRSADEAGRLQAQELMEVSNKAVAKGYASFTTLEELNVKFGSGGYRLIERFGVEQNGSIRACDNAKGGMQNECSAVRDKLRCEAADFPAVMADLLFRLCGPRARCKGCTDDLEKAYWRVPNSQPEFALVAQFDPVTQRVVIMQVPGLSFGLVSSVTNFNVLAEFTSHVVRRLLAVVTGHYYDDYVTLDPECAGTSAKDSLHWIHARLGFPFSTDAEKCKPMAKHVVFVGVVTDLSGFESGEIGLRVKPGRVEKIETIIAGIIGGHVARATLMSLVGKLQFTVATSYGRFGRAAINAIIASNGDASEGTLLYESLRFFAMCLRDLPGKTRRLGAHMQRGLVWVWSDAMYTARADAVTMADVIGYETGLGYLAKVAGSGRKSASRCTCPQDILRAMCLKLTYIGQLELLGILLPYWTEPETFAGKDVIHFVDNTSAIYCAIKDYSKSPDSARIVHCIHSVLVAFDITVWFEYVPSKENISDGPSRGDDEMAENLNFKFVEAKLPSAGDLFSVVGAWRAAQLMRRGSHKKGKRNRGSLKRKRS